MCACEATFVCLRCRDRWPLDVDPFFRYPDEVEQERRQKDLLGLREWTADQVTK